jgi:hypothetical protein
VASQAPNTAPVAAFEPPAQSLSDAGRCGRHASCWPPEVTDR